MIAQNSKFSNKDKKRKEVKAIIVILVENKVKKAFKDEYRVVYRNIKQTGKKKNINFNNEQ